MMDIDAHPLVQELLMQQDRLRKTVWALAILLILSVAGGGYQFARRHWPRSSAATGLTVVPNGDPTIAMVNGEPLQKSDVDAALEHVHGWPVLQNLVRESLVFQAARQKKLHLDDPDSMRAQQAVQGQGAGLTVEVRKVQARLLLRKLALADVTPSARHQFYEEFKPELTQYEVFVLLARSAAEIAKLKAELKSGQGMVELIGRPGHLGRRLGFMTMSEIEARLGPPVADAVEDEPANNPPTLGPFVMWRGSIFVRINSVKSSDTDLALSVDDALAAAAATATLENLARAGKVTYPLAEADTKNRATAASASPNAPPQDNVFGEVPAAVKERHVFSGLPSAQPAETSEHPK
ncbi:MAG TPA: hypothetical protein VGO93_29765 [Candidatus Xenobia bacterium]|jgi:hypothetical protein